MPSSIFIRIYGGILLVIMAVALCAYFFVQQVNEQRAVAYRDGMATGVFRLIALGASRKEGEARLTWLAEAGKLMDSPLAVVPPEREQFNDDELERLAEGRAIVRLYSEQNYADIYSRIPGARELYIKTRMVKVSEQQAKAMAIFFQEELEQYPGREERRVKELQRYLVQRGYQAGRVDGLLGKQTIAALTEYQAANGLAVGALTFESLKHLGIE